MTKYLAQLNAIIQERWPPHQVPKVPKATSVTFGTSEDSHLSPISGTEARLLAEAESAEEFRRSNEATARSPCQSQFRAELKLLREANAKVYATRTPWKSK
jgi:hypothetical protein